MASRFTRVHSTTIYCVEKAINMEVDPCLKMPGKLKQIVVYHVY